MAGPPFAIALLPSTYAFADLIPVTRGAKESPRFVNWRLSKLTPDEFRAELMKDLNTEGKGKTFAWDSYDKNVSVLDNENNITVSGSRKTVTLKLKDDVVFATDSLRNTYGARVTGTIVIELDLEGIISITPVKKRPGS
jgi:hypothetical protein